MTTSSVYFSPFDFPLAKYMWHTTIHTPGSGWKNMAWKIAKFVLLLIPSIAITLLDATLFNFSRTIFGNLYILLRGRKVEPPPKGLIKEFLCFVQNNWQGMVKIAIFAGTVFVAWSLWNKLDGWAAKLIAKENSLEKDNFIRALNERVGDVVASQVLDKEKSYICSKETCDLLLSAISSAQEFWKSNIHAPYKWINELLFNIPSKVITLNNLLFLAQFEQVWTNFANRQQQAVKPLPLWTRLILSYWKFLGSAIAGINATDAMAGGAAFVKTYLTFYFYCRYLGVGINYIIRGSVATMLLSEILIKKLVGGSNSLQNAQTGSI